MSKELAQAQALLSANRPQDALKAASAASAADPGDPRPHLVAARAHLALKDHFDARAAAGRALALEPESIIALRLLAISMSAAANRAEALKVAEKALAINAEDPESNRLVSALWLLRGRKKKAEHYAQMAVRLDPGYAAAHVALGESLLAQQRLRAAEQAFRAALRFDPRDSRAIADLGTVTDLLGDTATGAQLAQMGATIDAHDEVARKRVVRYARGGVGGLATWPIIALCLLGAFYVAVHPHEGTGFRVGLGGVFACLGFGLAAVRVARERHLSRDVRRYVHRQWNQRSLAPVGRRAGFRPWWWVIVMRIPTGVRALLALGLAVEFLMIRLQHSSGGEHSGAWLVIVVLALSGAYWGWEFANHQRLRLRPYPLYGPETSNDPSTDEPG
jgi:tetratricopeptide (TPR) repeat protein